MQNLLEIQDTLKTASAQQLMGLLQNPNPSVPQWAVVAQMNTNKEMLDEQTRQQGLGQPTVLEGLMGAASAPTPQTNVAGMPQGVASNMGQNMAPKTDTDQNTGIASVAPVATMASGGVLKMQDGGDPAEKTYTFIYPEGMNRPSFELEISASGAYNSVVKAIRELGGTIIEKDTGRVMQSDTAKEILQESSDVAEADARVPEYVPSASDLYGTESGRFKSVNAAPENYVVSAGLPPAGGAMYSSPTGGQGGNTDSSLLGLPTDEFSEVPLSSISTPEGLATLAAAGDADMRDEVVVGDTSTLSEKELRKQADNRNEAKRARFELMRALEATNSEGQPGGTLGKRYAESGDDLRMVDAQRYIESLIKGDPYSGELSPSQTARNQKTLSDTLRREEVARQRADIAEAGKIAQDAADTREAFSVPITIDATKPLMSSEALSNVKDAATLRTAALANTAKPKVTPDIAEFGKYADQYTEMRNEREVDSVVEAAERNEIARVKAKIAKREALNTSEKELADKITAFGEYADQYTTMRNDREVDMTVEAVERGEAARIAAKTERQNLLKEIKQNASVDQRSGLERLEAENEENLPEDMQRELDVRAIARTGAGVAETAKALGMGIVDVLDVGAGLIANGTLGASALATDIQSAIAAGILQDVDGSIELAGNADEMRELADEVFRNDSRVNSSFFGNYFPRLSTAVAKGVGIPTNAEADAAAAAEQTSAMDAKIMAMPDDSSVFAEGAPVEYTPAGLAAIQARKDELNREYGPADEVGNTIKTDMGINLDNLIREENAATAREGSFGLIPQVPKENVINNRFDFVDNEEGLPAPAPTLTTPAQMRESAEFMSRDAAGIGGYADGIPTQYEGQDKIGTPNVTLKQQAELSDASLDNLNTTAGDIQPPVPAPAPGFPPDGNYFLNKNLMEVYKSQARKAARDDAFKGTSTGPDEYLGDMYPDPKKTLKPKDATDNADGASGTSTGGAGISAALSAGAGSKSGSAGGYQDRLASILDRMEARKDEDKWMSLADMGLRLMGSKNPNFLGAVGESGLGALQGYRQQQGVNQKQEIGILGKLGDFDMAERTLQARMAIANASAAGRGGAKAKDVLAVLEARRAELTGPLAPTNLSPSEQVAKDTALADIDRQIGALTGVTINSTPQVVQADASDDVSFLGRINNYISSQEP